MDKNKIINNKIINNKIIKKKIKVPLIITTIINYINSDKKYYSWNLSQIFIRIFNFKNY